MVDNDFDGGVLIGPLGFVVREHEANRAVLNGGLSVAVVLMSCVIRLPSAVMVLILNGPTLVFVSVAILKIGF